GLPYTESSCLELALRSVAPQPWLGSWPRASRAVLGSVGHSPLRLRVLGYVIRGGFRGVVGSGQQGLSEGPQAGDGLRVGHLAPREGLLDLAVEGRLQAAASAVLQVDGDPASSGLVDLAVQVCLEYPC